MNRVVLEFLFKSEFPLDADFVSQLYDRLGIQHFIYRKRLSLQYETFRTNVLNVFRRRHKVDTPLDSYYDLIKKEFEGEIVTGVYAILEEQTLITSCRNFNKTNLWMLKISHERVP